MNLYQSLTRNDAVQLADLIVVLAGRMERKHYGLELFRSGMAPRLLLSVGRFEVSRMHQLDLPGIDRLIAMRDGTPPDDRNFFVEVDSTGVRFERAGLPRCSTYGEALALRRQLITCRVSKVMVISTDVHLRRVASVFAKVFGDMSVEFLYCPVPARFGFLQENGWWRRTDDRRFVLKEAIKVVGYSAILSTPEWAVRKLMRVKDRVA